MRILRIIPSLDRESGGPVTGLLTTSKSLSDLGHETEVLCITPVDEDARPYPYVTAHCVPVDFEVGKFKWAPSYSKWIVENANRFDVAIIHGLWNIASMAGWWGLTKAKLPYVLMPHGMMDPWFKEKYPTKHLVKQLVWSVQGRALKDASAVLFTSQDELEKSIPVFKGYDFNAQKVGYGIAPLGEASEQDLSKFKTKHQIPTDKNFILYLGRIHEKKGVDLLLSAYADFTKRPESEDLVIAGPTETDYAAQMMALAKKLGIKDRVHYTGMIGGQDKVAALSGSSAFILPSHQENFGLAVAEALAASKPVLISDQVNIWREIEACGAGIVQPDTLEGTKALFEKWGALSEKQRQQMGQNASACHKAHFSNEHAAASLESFLKKAIHDNE